MMEDFHVNNNEEAVHEHPRTVRAANIISLEDREIFIESFKRTHGRKKKIAEAFAKLPHDKVHVSGFQKTKFKGVGVWINLGNFDMQQQVNKLLEKKNLGPLTEFQLEKSVAYGKWKNHNLEAVVVVTTAQIGNPFKIAVQIEWLVSLADNEGSRMIEMLKHRVAQRSQKSFIFTQCAAKGSAIKFWRGRMGKSSWAHIFVGLFNIFDDRCLIYEDAEPMMA